MIYAGIDIGGTNIKSGLVDGDTGKLIRKTSCPFHKESGIAGAAQGIRASVERICGEEGISTAELGGIGVDVPGSISQDMSVVLHAYNLDFHHTPVKAEVEKMFPGLNVILANDADTAAYAELYGGAFSGAKTAVLLTLGTGLGGGIIIGGRIFRGGCGHGTEPGHMILNKDGELCTCGNRGCAETECAATWLKKQGIQLYHSDPNGLIREMAGDDVDKVDARMVVEAAKKKDPRAREVFGQYVDNLACAIVSFIHILDPEVVALGGGVSEAGDFLYEPLRRRVNEMNFFHSDYPIRPAKFGNDAGMIGSGMLAKNGYD